MADWVKALLIYRINRFGLIRPGTDSGSAIFQGSNLCSRLHIAASFLFWELSLSHVSQWMPIIKESLLDTRRILYVLACDIKIIYGKCQMMWRFLKSLHIIMFNIRYSTLHNTGRIMTRNVIQNPTAISISKTMRDGSL